MKSGRNLVVIILLLKGDVVMPIFCRAKQKLELSETWLDECIDYLSTHGPWSVDPPVLASYVFNVFLSMDIRLSAKKKVIPENIMVKFELLVSS